MMFGFGKNSQKEYQAELEQMATTWQFGVYKRLSEHSDKFLRRLDKDDRGLIVAGITNWIFRFGDYGPKAALKPEITQTVDASLPHCAFALGNEDDIVEITCAIIIAAAAQNIPLTKFERHFDMLAKFGIVKESVNIYVRARTRAIHIDKFLRPEHRHYYHYVQYGSE